MSERRKPALDPNAVVERDDGSEIRPGRFVSDSLAGITFTEPGEEEPEDEDDFDPDAPEDQG